jgi:hypothetical protein
MAIFGNTQYNPASVMLGSGGGSGPYMSMASGNNPNNKINGISPISAGTFAAPSGNGGNQYNSMPPISGGNFGIPTQSPGGTTQAGFNDGTNQKPILQNTLAPEAVRATGTGPFDSAYRQNLATYAGGQFQRPGDNLSFDPTSPNLFGNPTGGGNAPVLGMGNSLLSMGLGGQPAAFQNPSTPTANPTMGSNQLGSSLQNWLKQLNQFGIGGSNFAGNQPL